MHVPQQNVHQQTTSKGENRVPLHQVRYGCQASYTEMSNLQDKVHYDTVQHKQEVTLKVDLRGKRIQE